jgi:hypothetical protein
MKIVLAGFTTALLVFAVATAISELLLKSEASPSAAATTRQKSATAQTVRGSGRPLRPLSKTRRADSPADEIVDQTTADAQQGLSLIRQRESELRARQEAIQLMLSEIRAEQQAMDLMRRRVSAEIAALTDTAMRAAQRDAQQDGPRDDQRDERLASNDPSSEPVPRATALRTPAKPTLKIIDSQAAQDTAVLVNRLVQQGNTRSATLLLKSLKDRDATKVLTALAATDQQLALQLTEQLLATRDEEARRR